MADVYDLRPMLNSTATDLTSSVPSAIALPEDIRSPSPSTNGLKRRQSDILEQESKRQRTSPGKDSPTAKEDDSQANAERDASPKPTQTPEDSRGTKRKSGKTDEKQRSKRLFGALLGNLNQPSDRTSKRRSEIEQRRKAELQKQDDERLEDRQRRLERLSVHRKKEQINVDEKNMHTRHSNLLNAANFLRTTAEPELYYRPWDLLADEEDRIDDQVKDAQSQIDKERAEFEEEKRRRLGETKDSEDSLPDAAGSTDPPTSNVPPASADDMAGSTNAKGAEEDDKQEPVKPTDSHDLPAEVPESDAGDKVGTATSENDESRTVEPTPSDHEKKDEAEDDGEHVVEGDEDTVIY